MSTMEMQLDEVNGTAIGGVKFEWDAFRKLNLKKNQLIHRDAQYPVLLLTEGSVVISYSSEAYDKSYNTLLRGPAILRLDLEGDFKSCKIAAVLEPSAAVQVSAKELTEMMVYDRERFDYLLQLTFDQFRRLDQRADDLLMKKDAELRLLGFLDYEGKNYGTNIGETCYLRLPLSHRQIADVVFACRQSVSSTLSHLRKLDLIAYDRKSVIIYRSRFDEYLQEKIKEHAEAYIDGGLKITPSSSQDKVHQLPPIDAETVEEVAVA